ncbi:hypothetical protein BCR34DRAFT_590676 [Clohesyomyces aquaticus]|uniref:Uncharacterized protein n=1 Tax=Clohesyomyces aquaticus TaxID=1231657 RepID=A0A1Y1Z8V2_9PLEO|nr:hypothetical protein BCR34DRAFT_590676 [Clohesyomyces aquaticus]
MSHSSMKDKKGPKGRQGNDPPSRKPSFDSDLSYRSESRKRFRDFFASKPKPGSQPSTPTTNMHRSNTEGAPQPSRSSSTSQARSLNSLDQPPRSGRASLNSDKPLPKIPESHTKTNSPAPPFRRSDSAVPPRILQHSQPRSATFQISPSSPLGNPPSETSELEDEPVFWFQDELPDSARSELLPPPPKPRETVPRKKGPEPPNYPYSFVRVYLCGHPPETVKVEKQPSSKVLHHMIEPPPMREQLLLTCNFLRFTLRKCQACATEYAAQPMREVVTNQMVSRRGRGEKRDGFMDAMERFGGGLKGMPAGEVVPHDRIDEEEFAGGEPVVGTNGEEYQDRAVRMNSWRMDEYLKKKRTGRGIGFWRRMSGCTYSETLNMLPVNKLGDELVFGHLEERINSETLSSDLTPPHREITCVLNIRQHIFLSLMA